MIYVSEELDGRQEKYLVRVLLVADGQSKGAIIEKLLYNFKKHKEFCEER